MKNQKTNQMKTFCWAFCHPHRSIPWCFIFLPSHYFTMLFNTQPKHNVCNTANVQCYLPCRLAPSTWLDRHISHCMGCTVTFWHTGIAESSRGHTGPTGSLEGQKCLLEDKCFSLLNVCATLRSILESACNRNSDQGQHPGRNASTGGKLRMFT